MRLTRALTRAARPLSHRAGILSARVQLVGLLGGGRLGVGCVHAIGGILIKSRVQRPHALESAERGHAPLLDAALRRGGRIDEGLREVHVDLRVENIAQDLLASIRRGVEELGELALREHDRLQELVLIQTDNARNLVAHVARTRRDRLHRAPPVRRVRVLHDPRQRRLRIALRLLTRRGVRGRARHPVDARRHLKHQVRLRRIRIRDVVGAQAVLRRVLRARDVPVQGEGDRVDERGLSRARRSIQQEQARVLEGRKVDRVCPCEGADTRDAQPPNLHCMSFPRSPAHTSRASSRSRSDRGRPPTAS